MVPAASSPSKLLVMLRLGMVCSWDVLTRPDQGGSGFHVGCYGNPT